MIQDKTETIQKKDDYDGVSVIVITYNEERHIRDCLDSLLQLEYPENKFEVLVIDSSTDSTPDLVLKYKNVKLIRSQKGFSQQRNVGLNAAGYDIIAFTDADCIVPSNWLEVINRSFRDSGIVAIGGNAYPPPGTGFFGLCSACVGHPAGGAVGFDANVSRTPGGAAFVASCNCAFRKSVLMDVGGFDPEFYDGGEDVDISYRIRKAGYFLDYVPDLTVFHKARETLYEYIIWNLNVGITKFNIKSPRFFKIIFQPSFPLWSLLLLVCFIYLLQFPLILFAVLAGGWLLYLVILFIWANPFPLLIKRRKKIGINLLPIVTVVPFLIYLRQLCINLGQLKKWLRTYRTSVRES